MNAMQAYKRGEAAIRENDGLKRQGVLSTVGAGWLHTTTSLPSTQSPPHFALYAMCRVNAQNTLTLLGTLVFLVDL